MNDTQKAEVQAEEAMGLSDFYSTVRGFLNNPGIAWNKVQQAELRLIRAKANAEAVGAIRYDKDKVTGGTPIDMSDRVQNIIDREQDLATAKIAHMCEVMSLKYVLSRAKYMGLIDDDVSSMYCEYYGKGTWSSSLQEIADEHDIPKVRVWRSICSPEAGKKFCDAVAQVISEADMTYAEQDDYWEAMQEEWDAIREECDQTMYRKDGSKWIF